MKEADDHVHEQLDQLGMVARVCQASELVAWLDGQEQDHRKPGERRKCHRSDATPWLGMEPQAVILRAPMLGQDTHPICGFDQHGIASSLDGSDFPHPRCHFIGPMDRCVSLSHALCFQVQTALRWDTLGSVEGCDVTD